MDRPFRPLADLFPSWRLDVLDGDPPTRYAVADPGDELANVELSPGRILLLGGSPGVGKSSLATQLVVEALRRTPTLRAMVLNVEMPPSALLERQLARLSGVELTAIMRRETTADDRPRLEAAFDDLATMGDRLAFIDPRADLREIADAADAFNPDLILLDYVQRLRVAGKSASRRETVDAVMERLRRFADAGAAVLAVAAVGRQKNERGQSGYDPESLNLASFRESSELEFGTDAAFILARVDDADGMILKHLKSRYGETRDLHLRFDRKRQRFSGDPSLAAWSQVDAHKSTRADAVKADLAAAWQRKRPKSVKPSSDRYAERKDLE